MWGGEGGVWLKMLRPVFVQFAGWRRCREDDPKRSAFAWGNPLRQGGFNDLAGEEWNPILGLHASPAGYGCAGLADDAVRVLDRCKSMSHTREGEPPT